MPDLTEQQERSETRRPGIGSELNELKTHGSATADELREFIGSLRGKSPQEALGAVAHSGLTRGIVIATVGFVVLLVLFSVIPYGYRQIQGEEAAQASAGQQPVDDQSSETGSDRPNTTTQAAAVEAQDGGQTETGNGDEAAPDGADGLSEKLGIGETKAADPDENPLDSEPDIDKLLDGIE